MATSRVLRHRYWIWSSVAVSACAITALVGGRAARVTDSPTSASVQSSPPSPRAEASPPSEPVPAESEPQHALAPQVAAASAQPTQTAPGAPVIESPEVIASMDLEFVKEEVERMDRELEQRNAIERLNSGDTSQSERLELGALIQRAALFRHRLLEDAVEALALDVDRYGKTHEARVAELRKKSIRH